MQCRVEGGIGCSKQHSRVALVCANAPTHFWPESILRARKIFCTNMVICQLPTIACNLPLQAHTKLLPYLLLSCDRTFSSRTSFGQKWIFGDRFVEDIYLRAHHDTPCIRMYCITSGSELLVQQFKSYPDEFPFQDPSCLLRCTPVILKKLAKMHIDDAHDENLVAEETALHPNTRAQMQTADAAKVLDDPIILTTSSDDQTETIDEIAPPPPCAKITPPPPCASATTLQKNRLVEL